MNENNLNQFNEAFQDITPRVPVPFHQALNQEIKVIKVMAKVKRVKYLMRDSKRVCSATLHLDKHGYFISMGRERIYITSQVQRIWTRALTWAYGIHNDPEMILRGYANTLQGAVDAVNEHIKKIKHSRPYHIYPGDMVDRVLISDDLAHIGPADQSWKDYTDGWDSWMATHQQKGGPS